MPHTSRLLMLLSVLVCSVFSFAQSPSASPNEVSQVAAEAIAAFAPMLVHEVQLSGTAKAYAGSLQPTGTFRAMLQSTGEAKLQTDLGELSRTETTDAFGETRKCNWAGQDAVEHDVAHHNCQTALNWVVPDLDLQARVSALAQTVAVKKEQGISFQELSLVQPPGNSSTPAALISRLSTAKLSLEPTTFLPNSLSFNIHPDKDAGLDIPILVRYSDYRQVNGVTLPFHIQKYLNNSLILDLQVETAEVQ